MNSEQRVYLRGVKGRGDEVIKILTDRGGKNSYQFSGKNEECFYYIRYDGTIDSVDERFKLAYMLHDYYTELHLPDKTKWKAGDILVADSYRVIAVYRETSSDDSYRFDSYCAVDMSQERLEKSDKKWWKEDFRRTTPEEDAKFQETLHKLGFEWDGFAKTLVPWHWQPGVGEDYWFLSKNLNVFKEYNLGIVADERRISKGNCFCTREEAEERASAISKVLKAPQTTFDEINIVLNRKN